MASDLRLGYKASAEQFGPQELLDLSVRAEELGLDIVAVSDHFQPWRHTGGHSPAVMPWLGALGQRTSRALMGTSVLTPTLRYHPSVVAQSFATLACLAPGRVFLGVGTGEAMNETPPTGTEWPGAKERRQRLREAIELMRRLWTEERVTFEGELLPHRTRDGLRPARRSPFPSSSPPPARSPRSSPAASATASSARAASSPSCTGSYSLPSRRAPRRPAATPRRSSA